MISNPVIPAMLPISFTSASDRSERTVQHPIGNPERRSTTARVALVIEDEPLVAMELTSILEDMGYQVCGVAETRREAIAEAQRHKPSLILADMRLRGGDDGIEAVSEILSGHRAAVVYVTGNRQSAEQRLKDAILVGKPFMLPSLQSAIHTAEKRALD